MRGHVRRHGKHFAVVVYLGTETLDDGRKKAKYRWHHGSWTEAEAKRELAKLLLQLDAGEYVEPNRLTVEAYLRRWLIDHAAHSVKPTTLHEYKRDIETRLIPAFRHHKLQRIPPHAIEAAYARWVKEGALNEKGERGKPLSPQRVKGLHRILHAAFATAVRWRLIARNPADAVQAPKYRPREMTALDGEGAARLLEALKGSPVELPVLLAVTLGLRRGEILALRWSDVDLEVGELEVPRAIEVHHREQNGVKFTEAVIGTPKSTRSRRAVSMPQLAIDALRAYKVAQNAIRLALGPRWHDGGLVFTAPPRRIPKTLAKRITDPDYFSEHFPEGRLWHPDAFTAHWRTALERAGLTAMRFHDLRHTNASIQLQAGVSLRIVAERLGHSSPNLTLSTYSHVLPRADREAASAIDAALKRGSA